MIHLRHNDRFPMSGSEETSNGSSGGAAPFRAFVLAGLNYARARLELAGVEGKEAFARLGGLLLLGGLAFTLMVSGVLMLCMAVVFLVARLIGGENAWIWVALGMGTLLVGAARLTLYWAASWLEKPMFPATLEEFRKDDAWLRSTAGKPR